MTPGLSWVWPAEQLCPYILIRRCRRRRQGHGVVLTVTEKDSAVVQSPVSLHEGELVLSDRLLKWETTSPSPPGLAPRGTGLPEAQPVARVGNKSI